MTPVVEQPGVPVPSLQQSKPTAQIQQPKSTSWAPLPPCDSHWWLWIAMQFLVYSDTRIIWITKHIQLLFRRLLSIPTPAILPYADFFLWFLPLSLNYIFVIFLIRIYAQLMVHHSFSLSLERTWGTLLVSRELEELEVIRWYLFPNSLCSDLVEI